MSEEGCCYRFPGWTLLATLLCIAGAGLYCPTLFLAVTQTKDLFTMGGRQSSYEFDLLVEVIKWASVGLAAWMGLMSLVFLCVGCMAKNVTDVKSYGGYSSNVRGGICNGFTIVITYLLFLLWLGVSGFSVLPVFLFYLTSTADITVNGTSGDCINLKQFGLDVLFDVNGTATTAAPGTTTAAPTTTAVTTAVGATTAAPSWNFTVPWEYCETDLKSFQGTQGEQLFLFYVLALVGALLITLSMVHFLMAQAANFVHIRESREALKYEDTKQKEEQELNIIMNSRQNLAGNW
ncbi:PREDICTED: proteolipid protein DM beta-like [Branchiostoma belcheri]|uniref:Proteolipid protein DM beta-like n=1 Tax=Branchiostoma belcheri TaxID=7741 RepID=A0A6P4Y8H8_BRABE|nr:PREDICTED: proteolipid protein DM beta-like [Branchiostoma belcheri]